MQTPSIDIASLLTADSHLSLVIGTDLFIGKEPRTPKNCVTIFDSFGYPPQLTMEKSESYYYPTIQIRVRNIDYQIGYDMIQDIMVLLHGVSHTTINSTYYSVIRCSGGPALLDWDDNGLVRFIANFEIQRR